MKAKTFQNSFLTGVLDSRAAGRVDTDAYNSAMLRGDNVVVHHLGGVFRRPGLKFVQELPNVLSFSAPSSSTAPEGGTPANASDESDSTSVITNTGILTDDPFVVVRYDLGTAKSISHADVHQIAVTSGSTDEFFIQYSNDDAVWNTLGNALPVVDTTARTYRRTGFSVEGNLSPISARYWRVAKVGGTTLSGANASLTQFNLWVDTGVISNVRLFSYEKTTDLRFLVAVTDRSATVLLNGVIPDSGTFPLPYASADLPDLDGATGADAIHLTHEDYAPRYILALYDSGDDMETAELSFTSLPQYDYNDASSPAPTSEVQNIVFDANWVAGDTFQVELDGARSGLVSFAGDSNAAQQQTTAANIAREVQKLYTIPGFTGVTCARTGALTYQVTFADGSAKPYEGLLTVTVGTTSSTTTPAATTSRIATGVARTENVWSATRGYPRTVTFFGGRLYFGGTKSRLQSLFGSAVNDITSFELLEQLDADPIFVTLNGQQLNAINGVFSGRTLELFTTGGEYRYIKRQGDPITPEDLPAAQTQYGSRRVRPINIDGSTLFVQRLGKSVRDFRFDFEEDSYNSFGLSSLAPNLISGAIDLAGWQGSATDEINLVYVVNTDGTVAVLNLRREAEVRAWTRWFTGSGAVVDDTDEEGRYPVSGHDLFKAVATTVEEVYFAVVRDVNGTSKLFIEQTDDDMFVDSGANVTGGVSGNMSHLSGESCRVRLQADDIVLADQNGGTITPSETEYVNAAIQAGLNFNPTVRPMPLQSQGPQGSNFINKRRIKKLRVKVSATLGLFANDKQLPDRYFDIDVFGQAPMRFSGNHTVEDTSNWDETEDKLITFTQTDPLPMHILAVVVDMESS